MNEKLIAFYDEYVKNGSNIAVTATANKITPAQCFKLVQYGEELKAEATKN